MSTDDPYNLERFVGAQNANGTYERALEELRWGRKSSHWMWFVFPQIAGLGHSATSREFRDLVARGSAGVSAASTPRAALARVHASGSGD